MIRGTAKNTSQVPLALAGMMHFDGGRRVGDFIVAEDVSLTISQPRQRWPVDVYTHRVIEPGTLHQMIAAFRVVQEKPDLDGRFAPPFTVPEWEAEAVGSFLRGDGLRTFSLPIYQRQVQECTPGLVVFRTTEQGRLDCVASFGDQVVLGPAAWDGLFLGVLHEYVAKAASKEMGVLVLNYARLVDPDPGLVRDVAVQNSNTDAYPMHEETDVIGPDRKRWMQEVKIVTQADQNVMNLTDPIVRKTLAPLVSTYRVLADEDLSVHVRVNSTEANLKSCRDGAAAAAGLQYLQRLKGIGAFNKHFGPRGT